ncbi:MAG: SRPBCC family protein [Aquihabitans sp.]
MDEEHVAASLVIGAPPEAVFSALADPTTHAAVDGTGWVQGADDAEPITAVGQVFRMEMFHPNHPDGIYATANLVEVFDPPHAISWRTGTEDAETGELSFGGWFWRYDLATATDGGTEVTLTYDWSAVGPEVREHLTFPPFGSNHLPDSLAHLAEVLAAR